MGMYLSELIEQANKCLENIGLSSGTIDDYQCSAFRPIERRLGNSFITDSSIIQEQETHFLCLFDSEAISRQTLNWRIRGIRILVEVFDTGCFDWKVFSKKKLISIPKAYEDLLERFIEKQTCSDKRKACKRSICRRFLNYLSDEGIIEVSPILPQHVSGFIVEISKDRPKSMDDVISSLKGFFQFLCGCGMYDSNHWLLLSAPRSRDYRVRDCVTIDEVIDLLESIPRDTPCGKRDFAAMSLAAVSGLRAGDIAALEFGDVDWMRCEIRIIQGKTSEPLILPVSKSMLNALADYILNGRPKTDDRHIFVRHCAPFCRYHDGVSIACIFRKYLKKAGIKHAVGDGKTLHGMRRGLGTGMAVNGVSVDLVAQVLGHNGTKATKQYISADMERLRECALSLKSLGGDLR